MAENRLISHRRSLVRKYNPNGISLHKGMKIEIWIEVANACLRSHIWDEIYHCPLILHVPVRLFEAACLKSSAAGFVSMNKWHRYLRSLLRFNGSDGFLWYTGRRTLSFLLKAGL